MKRGLVAPAHAGAEAAVFSRRLEALRRGAEDAGMQAALVYADVSRSSGIDYLTHFCLYWNEAVLAVPLEGLPALVTKLSKRVQPWIRRTSVLEDVRSGPRLAANVAAFVEERLGTRAARIGIVDLDWWPNAVVTDLEAAMPQADLEDLPGAVRNLRLIPDAEEASLLREAGNRLEAAADAAWSSGGSLAERGETAVRMARLAGFLDVDVDSGKLGDGTEYIDVVGQYRYVWVRRCRTGRGPAGRLLDETLRAVLGELRAGASENMLAAHADRHVGGRYRHIFSCLSHADIESGGSFRRLEEPARPFHAGEVVSAVLTIYDGGALARAAETVVVGRDGAEPLTGGGQGG
jgi:hypothetical protein